MKYLIIGGVAGGATAAARIRRIDESGEIILFEKGRYISYANCGLPYYIGGTITDRDKLFVQTPSSFGKRFNIDVRIQSEVIEIDTESKQVRVRQEEGVEYFEKYDKLLLSPGAVPVRPPLKGIKNDAIFTLRNVDDTDSIKHFISTRKVESAIVVGGGFIGLEMAENLHNIGARVAIVEMGDQVMAPLDYSIASHVHQHLLRKGVSLYLKQGVESFSKNGSKVVLHLTSGTEIESDMVILSIGVRANTTLAQKSGLKIGEAGGILVNEFLETSVSDVYAVGDAIEYPHPLTGIPYLNFLANPANRQGRIVADNMVFGNKVKYEGAIGTSIAKVFDLTAGATGLAAKRLKRLGIEYASTTTHSASHAGYYPDSYPLTIKLVYNPHSGQLYGAQCIGADGVDKRIDEIATIIKHNGTVYDLMQIEHAYAPPYSSAKDPAAIAGYVASNVINGTMPIVTWREMAAADPDKVLLLDVRTEEEFKMGSIAGAVNIPLDDLRDRLSEIPDDKEIYLFCAVGLRGYLALKILTAKGFKNVKNLTGGYKTYSAATAPITSTPAQTPTSTPTAALKAASNVRILKIDACGLQCPGPIMKLKQAVDSASEGDRLEIVATDPGFARDSQAWCNTTGNKYVSMSEEKGKFKVVVEKGGDKECALTTSCDNKAKTLIMFSDDLDKALATFVLANGAAATGHKTTIFFTFWGLNVIKKRKKPHVQKDFFGKMFSMMLPSHSRKLHLSKMSMFGMGDKMMRLIMKRKNIASLEELRQQAVNNGVEFIACQMSMDVMGVKKEELLDCVTVGGVATYMERAENANVNLFI